MTGPCKSFAFLLLAALAPAAAAQIGPEETVQRILDEIRDELAEIDRLLLETSSLPRSDAGSADKVGELLGATQESQAKVTRGIDRLLEELQQHQQNSSQQPSSGDQDQQQQEEQQQGQQGGQRRPQQQRDHLPTPEMVDQTGQQQQQGHEQTGQQQPGQAQPSEGRDPLQPGDNVDRGAPTPEGTERIQRPQDGSSWGTLPPYVHLRHSRGGMPEVPEKYRRLLEAYQRKAHEVNRR